MASSQVSACSAATRFNGFAELATANASDVFPLPERMSFEEGAAVPVNYGTAYAGVVLMAAVRPGERVLVHAAAGAWASPCCNCCRTAAPT